MSRKQTATFIHSHTHSLGKPGVPAVDDLGWPGGRHVEAGAIQGVGRLTKPAGSDRRPGRSTRPFAHFTEQAAELPGHSGPYDQRHGFPRAPHVAELLTR